MECGSGALHKRIPEGDNRDRFVCSDCETIHYQNPKVVAGCLMYHGSKVLLARRSIEPRHGFWTLPAGFMELGESAIDGAARECHEEALATPVDPSLYAVFSLPRVGQVYLMYQGQLAEGRYGVGEESSDVALFEEEEIPWDHLAFPIVQRTLTRFFADRAHGTFEVFEELLT